MGIALNCCVSLMSEMVIVSLCKRQIFAIVIKTVDNKAMVFSTWTEKMSVLVAL